MKNPLLEKHNTISLFVFLVGVGAATMLCMQESKTIEEQSTSRFEAKAKQNYFHILNELNNKKKIIVSIQALFKASEFVDANEFEIFCREFIQGQNVLNLFWKNSFEDQEYLLKKSHTKSYLNQFDLLSRAKLIENENPKMLVSEFTSSYSKSQKGYLGIVFDLRNLITYPVKENYSEYFIVNDGNKNTLHYFKLTETAMKEESVNINTYENYKFFEIYNANDVRFLYLKVKNLDPIRDEQVRYLFQKTSLFLLITFIVTAYSRSILYRKKNVEEIVALKTEELVQFNYRISHDLVAPLKTVRGLCELAREDYEEENYESAKYYNQSTIDQVIKLESLISDINSLNKADHIESEKEAIDFNTIVNDIKGRLLRLAEQKEVELKEYISLDLAFASNPIRIKQVIENLISNGIKYSDPQKKERYVEIHVFRESPLNVSIMVRDNGIGIQRDFKEIIFQMFTRGSSKSSFGSGLGMYLVKKHIDYLQGKIMIMDREEGTSFKVVLPG